MLIIENLPEIFYNLVDSWSEVGPCCMDSAGQLLCSVCNQVDNWDEADDQSTDSADPFLHSLSSS
jgi:hypothetical protein